MPSSELQLAFNEIASVRSLPPELIIDALQSALVSAFRKFSGASTAQAIRAQIEPSTGRVSIFVEKEVVEDIFSPPTEVLLEKARYYHPECEIGDMVMVKEEGTAKGFGRIAAQTAKQVILQKIREAERTTLYNEFIEREGDLLNATVQSLSPNMVTLSLGRAEAVLPRNQQIPGERYRQHDKLRVYVLEVKSGSKGPQIICSRSHRDMLRRLLEYEVPEIYNKQVEIKNIAREAGQRSKVAVAALQEGIDPVGACVGMKGIRIQNIVKELHDERIDIIEWTPSSEQFILNALSPARVTGVYLEDDLATGRTAVVIVPDDQLSLAIGKEGQNARLAAKLTGWRIDIKSVMETVQGALENLDVHPLSSLMVQYSPLIEDVRRIVQKRLANGMAQPEELNQLASFANLVERTLYRDREAARREQEKQVEAVRATIPPVLFKMEVNALGLDDNITTSLEPLGNIGQVMLSLLVDESRLRRLLKAHEIPLLQEALDNVMSLDLDEIIIIEEDPTQAQVVATPEAVVTTQVPVAVAETLAPVVVAEDEEEEVIKDAFGGVVVATPTPETAPTEFKEEDIDEYTYEFVADTEGGEVDLDADKSKDKKKDKKKNRRQLIYDEDSGEVRTNRQRKSVGNRGKNWGDLDF